MLRLLMPKICLMLAPAMMFAQKNTVSGTVTEQASGYPALGNSVLVKGTANGQSVINVALSAPWIHIAIL